MSSRDEGVKARKAIMLELRHVAGGGRWLTTAEVCSRTGLPRRRVQRALLALEKRSVVERCWYRGRRQNALWREAL